MSALAARLQEIKARHDATQRVTLRKHVLALALCHDTGEAPFEEAFQEVRDPAGRRILLAVFAVARVLNEAVYYQNHSAVADSDATAEGARAQLQEAHENRDKYLDGLVSALLRDVPMYIEDPLAKFATGDTRWGT